MHGPREGKRSGLRRVVALIKTRGLIALFVLIGLVHLIIGLSGVGSEWLYHHHGWAGARRSINARNYLRFGYIETRLAPLDNIGAARDAKGQLVKQAKYWHHPPGLSVLLSLAFALLGDSEPVARSVSILLSMASLIMLMIVFGKSLGAWEAFIGCVFLSFMPIYATYLNFVNYEPLVVFSMVALIFIYECYRQEKKWWKLIFLGLIILIGAFSDYPLYPFLFYFWVVLAVLELRQGARGLWPVAIFALLVLVATAALLIQVISMQDSFDAFKRLFLKRHDLGEGVPITIVLKKWHYYVWFFNPLTLIFAAFWISDLCTRAVLGRMRRADGYLSAMLLAALTYWLLIPQGAKIHEYAVYYFSPFMAFAAGGGLVRFAETISYDSRRVKIFFSAAVIALFVITSIPSIYAKKICPVYEFVSPVHKLDSGKMYDFHVPYNIIGRFLKAHTKPEESIGIYAGFDIRPEFQYYLDRNHRIFPKRVDVTNAFARRNYAFVMINGNSVGSDLLSLLLKRVDFVYLDHFYAFDLGHHMESIVFLRRKIENRGILYRYLNTMAYPAYREEEDPWSTIDITLKLRGLEEALRLEKDLKPPKTRTLEAAVSGYNLNVARGQEPDFVDVQSCLTGAGEMTFADAIEYLGSRIEKKGGRTTLQLLFLPRKDVDCNVYVEMKAEPLHANKKMREEIGVKRKVMKPVIPSSIWRPGYIYIIEDELQLFSGPYSLSFQLLQNETYQVLNESGNDNLFPIACKEPPKTLPSGREMVISRVTAATSTGNQTAGDIKEILTKDGEARFLVPKELGSDMMLVGCVAVPYGPQKWGVRLLLHNFSVDDRDLHLTLNAKGAGLTGPADRSLDLGHTKGGKGPGRTFTIEETFDADPGKLKITLIIAAKGVPSPLQIDGKAMTVSLGKGDFGIHFPMQWLYGYGSIH